jgi:hypothetical protein
MTAIVPSFIAKLNRSEAHLVNLKDAIDSYGGTTPDTRPYTVRKRVEGKKKRVVYRLHFTRSIDNTDVPLIAADAIYNLRSSLDHLAGALVPAKDRRSVMFPILWRGVAEPSIEGENDQRRKDRERWLTIAHRVRPEAATFLKRLQPPDETPKEETPHALRLLNQISNIDRHTKLPIFAHGVDGLLLRWRLPDGGIKNGFARASPDHFLEDNTEIRNVPEGAVYMEAYGPPRIIIRTGMTDAHGRVNLPVVEFITETLRFIRDEVVPGLTPYIHRPGGRRK